MSFWSWRWRRQAEQSQTAADLRALAANLHSIGVYETPEHPWPDYGLLGRTKALLRTAADQVDAAQPRQIAGKHWEALHRALKAYARAIRRAAKEAK